MKIEWIENKSDDWKLATIADGANVTKNVSINRTNKKGEVFPDFDNLQAGREVDGNLWESSQGKWYLFPVTKPTPGIMGNKPAYGVAKNMERKETSISKSMDRKDNAITLAGTARDATLLTVNFYPELATAPDKEEAIKLVWEQWRGWLIERSGDSKDITETKQPF